MSLPTEVLADCEDGNTIDSDLYRDMRWCANCGGEKIFVEVFEFDCGRLGVCLGCGQERVIRFSRVTKTQTLNGKAA